MEGVGCLLAQSRISFHIKMYTSAADIALLFEDLRSCCKKQISPARLGFVDLKRTRST